MFDIEFNFEYYFMIQYYFKVKIDLEQRKIHPIYEGYEDDVQKNCKIWIITIKNRKEPMSMQIKYFF